MQGKALSLLFPVGGCGGQWIQMTVLTRSSILEALHFAHLTSDHIVSGLNPTRGKIQLMTVQLTAQSLSLSSICCLLNCNIVEMDLKCIFHMSIIHQTGSKC